MILFAENSFYLTVEQNLFSLNTARLLIERKTWYDLSFWLSILFS